VPDTIEDIKVRHIKEYGGDVIKVPLSERLIRARDIAAENGGFFMNQFGNADKAEEYHESRFKNESGASLWVEPGMAGIGYGPMGMARKGETTSMDAAVIDRVVKVPDVAATAAMRILREQGASGGTSSGVNLLTSMHIAATAV
ncbi:hypothetical protein TELCIR_20018, partial [Teladorsagia circumcincta]